MNDDANSKAEAEEKQYYAEMAAASRSAAKRAKEYEDAVGKDRRNALLERIALALERRPVGFDDLVARVRSDLARMPDSARIEALLTITNGYCMSCGSSEGYRCPCDNDE